MATAQGSRFRKLHKVGGDKNMLNIDVGLLPVILGSEKDVQMFCGPAILRATILKR